MRLFSGRCLLLAACFAAMPAASQTPAPAPRDPPSGRLEAAAVAPGEGRQGGARPAPPPSAGMPIPPALRPPRSAVAAAPPPHPAAGRPLGRYTTWGMVIGGAAGLAYGVAYGDDAFELSPVIETAIGIGVGFYIGAAADIVRSLRSRAR